MKKVELVTIMLFCIFLAGTLYAQKSANKVLVNHVGYEQNGEKKVVFQTASNEKPSMFSVINCLVSQHC